MSLNLQAYDYFDRQNSGSLGTNWSSSSFYVQDGAATAASGNHYSIFTGYTPIYPTSLPYNWIYEARVRKPARGTASLMEIGLIHQSYAPSVFPLSNFSWPIYREFVYYETNTSTGITSRHRLSNGNTNSVLFNTGYTWADNTYKNIRIEYDVLQTNTLSYYIDNVLVYQGYVPTIYNVNLNAYRALYAGLLYITSGSANTFSCDWFTVGRWETGVTEVGPTGSPTYSLTGISFSPESEDTDSSLPQPDVFYEESISRSQKIEETYDNYLVLLPQKERSTFTLKWSNRTKVQKDDIVSTFIDKTGTGPIAWAIPNENRTVYLTFDGKINILMKTYNVFDIEAVFTATR